MSAAASRPMGRRIYVRPYEVHQRLHRMGLSIEFLTMCASRGDLDRRSVPVFGFEGHDEYAANSRVLSTMCEEGGQTDGGWHRGSHLGIPVALNATESIAINSTTGGPGTGQPDGEAPTNRSLKGPRSSQASRVYDPQQQFDMEDPDNRPVDFWWFFTRRDDHGLWVEMFSPVVDTTGFATDFNERIIIGNVDGPPAPTIRKPDNGPIVDVTWKQAG